MTPEEARECAYCSKTLVQAEDEKDFNFKKRKYCNKVCSGAHTAERVKAKTKKAGPQKRREWNAL